ncbi:MAG: ATP-binding protein [Alphaproteobacteria bacterium]|nr:ATP-binding protein [Alphaproteobacteria bacterium]
MGKIKEFEINNDYNSVFIIDEMDKSLHPQLTRRFIENFLHYAKRKDVQLIISTHESHLLDLEMVRQDEIFFVESTPTGDSVLYPFDRFKERFDKKIEKAYLDGRYGGVPIFDSIIFPNEDIE